MIALRRISVRDVRRQRRFYLSTSILVASGKRWAKSSLNARRIDDQSIRFVPQIPDGAAVSHVLLDMTIEPYWLSAAYPRDLRFSAELKRIADSKRAQVSAIIAAFGRHIGLRFVRQEGPWRVFVADHEHAQVEWRIMDDGHTINGLTWRRID
ncbi:hypothetical protein [Sphingomonas sp.]|uniref:hypothetical protein n=1 Tax=Sphingomonas sp. TaxID=28214 RepID=UPI003CC65424